MSDKSHKNNWREPSEDKALKAYLTLESVKPLVCMNMSTLTIISITEFTKLNTNRKLTKKCSYLRKVSLHNSCHYITSHIKDVLLRGFACIQISLKDHTQIFYQRNFNTRHSASRNPSLIKRYDFYSFKSWRGSKNKKKIVTRQTILLGWTLLGILLKKSL